MPPTQQLTEAHRLAQLALGAQTVRQMRAVFPLLDPADLDGTFDVWLVAVVPLIQAQRSSSATLAATYLTAFRALTLGVDSAFTAVLAAPADVTALTTSMLVTGPISLRSNLGRKMNFSQALAVAEGRTAAAGMRHTLNGGRDTITETVKADKRAVGWARVASGKACDFCSMLAGRGAVYGEASADFEAHDGCVLGATTVRGPRFEAAFRRWYEGELIIIGLAGGDELAVTPKHPILTDRGWVDAGLLSQSDRLAHSVGGDRVVLGAPHEHEMPSPVEDVWRAYGVDGFRSVPVTAEDFHGDGMGTQGDVDVVAPNGLFPDVFYAAPREFVAERVGTPACASSVTASLSSRRDLGLMLLGPHNPAHRVMSGSGLRDPLLRCECRQMQVGRFARSTDVYSALDQSPTYHVPRHPQTVGQPLYRLSSDVPLADLGGQVQPGRVGVGGMKPRFDPPSLEENAHSLRVKADLGRRLLERLSCGVQLGRPVELRRIRRWSGHVYNLRTSEGWYAASGVIVSNCACSAEPVYR